MHDAIIGRKIVMPHGFIKKSQKAPVTCLVPVIFVTVKSVTTFKTENNPL